MNEVDYIDSIWGDEGQIFHDEWQKHLNSEAKRAAENEELIRDYMDAFSTPAGRRVFLDILVRARVFETTFTGNSKGMFQEGERSLGLYVLHMFMNHKFKGERE